MAFREAGCGYRGCFRINWTRLFKAIGPSLAGVLLGAEIGVFDGIASSSKWLRTIGISEDSIKLSSNLYGKLNGALAAGNIAGALAAMYMAEVKGRKFGMVFSCAIYAAGVAAQVLAQSWGVYIAGKAISGAGLGLIMVIALLYQAECSAPALRGFIVSTLPWVVPLGLGLGYLVTNGCRADGDSCEYRFPIAMQLVPIAGLVGLMFLLPESPRWLLSKGHDSTALRALSSLTGQHQQDSELQKEFHDIQADVHRSNLHTLPSLLINDHQKLPLRTCIALLLQLFQSLLGSLFTRSLRFVLPSDCNFVPSLYSSPGDIVSCLWTLAMGLPGLFLVDTFGRRALLVPASGYLILSNFITGGLALVPDAVRVDVVARIQAVLYSSSWGLVPFVIVSELFPLHHRAKGISLSLAANFLFSYLVSLLNNHVDTAIDLSSASWIRGAIAIPAVLFVWLVVPETRSLSLEQIERLFEFSEPRTSDDHRRRIIHQDSISFEQFKTTLRPRHDHVQYSNGLQHHL